MEKRTESRSSKRLDKLLSGDSEEARDIKDAFYRANLWRLRTGRRRPTAETAGTLEHLSRGFVPANGWGDL